MYPTLQEMTPDVSRCALHCRKTSAKPLFQKLSFLWMMVAAACPLLFPCTSSSSDDPNKLFLTKETFEGVTANKTVFIKWAAPWCSHSQDLAPAWDRLAAASATNFEHSSSDPTIPLLIAEVDCSKESDWCTEMGYTAYPTLTYGDASNMGRYLHTYQSLQKDFDSLHQFVESTLWEQAFCTPGNYLVDGFCNATEKARIQQYYDVSLAELASFIEREESLLHAAEETFRKSTATMKAQYDKLSKGREKTKAQIKRQLQLMKQVLEKE